MYYQGRMAEWSIAAPWKGVESEIWLRGFESHFFLQLWKCTQVAIRGRFAKPLGGFKSPHVGSNPTTSASIFKSYINIMEAWGSGLTQQS